MRRNTLGELFPGDVYRTPDNLKKPFIHYVFFGTRLGFYFRYVRRLLENWSVAKRGLYTSEEWTRRSYDIYHDTELFGAKYVIEGLDNLRKDYKSAVIVSNHQSTLETMVFPCIINGIRPVTFVMKDVLITSPIIGPVFRAVDPVVVGRKNPREDLQEVLNEGTARLDRGKSIIIFPESSRAENFVPSKFNSLGVKLARKAKVPVIPVAIKTDYWGIGKIIKGYAPIRPERTVHIKFGSPLTVEGNGSAQHQQTVEFIADSLREWGGNVIEDEEANK